MHVRESDTTEPDSAEPGHDSRRRTVADLIAVAGVAVVIGVAAAVGWSLIHRGVDIFLPFPPLMAYWQPHVHLGSALAVLTAVLVVGWGPTVAARLAWRPLLAVGYLAAVAWTFTLALVDGYRVGILDKLQRTEEYLHDVPRVHSVLGMLRDFSEHIVAPPAQSWTTHVAAHPPGAFLVFVALDRLGLADAGIPGIVCILVGSSACVAVAVVLRSLGAENTARVVLPFGVLFPGAVWIGVSADGLFAGVLVWGVALLAMAAKGSGWRATVTALGGGLLLGYTVYLSYGLLLGGAIAAAVVVLTRAWRAAVPAVLGFAVVVAAFSAAGFWWPNGYRLTKIIYYASIASTRPYWYFVWADLAALACALGPAVVAGLRRAVARPRELPVKVAVLAGVAVAVVLAADLSGLSKAEVERIWLPFGVWLTIPCALLPGRQVRWWLAAQAVLALAINHLLLTFW